MISGPCSPTVTRRMSVISIVELRRKRPPGTATAGNPVAFRRRLPSANCLRSMPLTRTLSHDPQFNAGASEALPWNSTASPMPTMRRTLRFASGSCTTGSCILQLLFLPHLAFAALAAIWDRLRGLSFAALAGPPFSPPSRPRATAWGFLGTSGCCFGAWPVDSSMIWYASWFGSRGRFFDRSGMMPSVWQGKGRSQGQENSN